MVEFGQKLGISDFSQAESSMPVESARFITLSAPISVQWEVTPGVTKAVYIATTSGEKNLI